MGKRIVYVLGIITGIVLIIYGLFYTDYSFENVSDSEDGGDAYTGIQNAAAATANNIKELGWMLNDLLSTIIVASGVLVELHYFEKIAKDVSTHENGVTHNAISKDNTNTDNNKK